MIIVPLGVASATPTTTRHLPSLALWREGSIFLFDCGENAQMRMLQAGLKRSKIEAIMISHFDVDHYSGLIGLLATFQLQRREKPLTLIGPAGIREFVEWNLNFAKIETCYPITIEELQEGFEHEVVLDGKDYYIEARPLQHSSFCIGYRFQEKDKPGKVDAEKATELGITEDEMFKDLKAGKDVTLEDGTVVTSSSIVGHPRPGDSFAYITDTEYCQNSVKLAMNTNILFHEATFGDNLEDRANTNGHSTASDAARVANEAKTKLLVIGHFSARYTNPFVLLREARKVFYPTWLASELRPIFTDPAHEKGIVTPKVIIKEISENGQQSRHSGKGGYQRGGGKNFRPRKRFDDRGGDYRGSRQGGYRGDDYRSQDDRYDRGGGGGRYGNRYGNDRYGNDRYDRGGGGGGRYNQDDRSDRYDRNGGGGRYGQGDRDERYASGSRYTTSSYDRQRVSRSGESPSAGYSRDGGGYNRDSSYNRDAHYQGRNRRDRYDEGTNGKDESSGTTKHITPRSPYDDFDRF